MEHKRGIVVQGRGSQVRVQFADNDDVISGWMDVVQRSTSGMRVFTRPRVGSQVVVAVDDNREHGVVLGALYSDVDPAPAGSEGTLHFEMPDGSSLIWDGGFCTIDHASGLQITLGDGKITLKGDLEVDGDVSISGDVQVSGKTDLADTKINGVRQVGD